MNKGDKVGVTLMDLSKAIDKKIQFTNDKNRSIQLF